LLRNLDVTEGQCNGTRMLVTSLADNYIECEILCGISKGKRTLIPKMKMTASDLFVPNPIVRFQLPVARWHVKRWSKRFNFINMSYGNVMVNRNVFAGLARLTLRGLNFVSLK